MLFLSASIVFGQTTGDIDAQSADHIIYGAESDFSSRYVWHGLAASPAGVMQNCAWVSRSGLTGSVWSNCDLASGIVGPRFNEFDFSLAYATSYKALGLETSLQRYLYPDQPEIPSTTEASFDLSWNAGHFQPFVIYTFDIEEYRGARFGEAGLRSAWDASGTVCIEVSTGVGWGSTRFNEAYINESKSALNMAAAEVGLTWNCAGGLYLRPHALMTTLLDAGLRGAVETPDIFQIGIGVGGEF